MKGKDLKWLVSMIPDDALVTIDNNPNVEIVAVDCDGIADRVHNLVLTEGWSIANDAELDTMSLRLRQLIEGYRSQELEQEQDIDEAAYRYTNSVVARSVGKAWLQRDVIAAFKAGVKWKEAQK